MANLLLWCIDSVFCQIRDFNFHGVRFAHEVNDHEYSVDEAETATMFARIPERLPEEFVQSLGTLERNT
jgi:hypothetical protein